MSYMYSKMFTFSIDNTVFMFLRNSLSGQCLSYHYRICWINALTKICRELNELRKPSTDNPEILRFFRYMKAAKDGQDGQDCMRIYPGCSAINNNNSASPPMIKTYHDINKLVQARRLSRSMTPQEEGNETHTAQVTFFTFNTQKEFRSLLPSKHQGP